MKKINSSKIHAPINKQTNINSNINNPIKITNYYTPHTSDITSKENPDLYTEFLKLRKEIEENINLELNNINIPKNLTNSLITLLNTYQDEIFNNINKNYNSNKLKEIISVKLENILNFTKNQFKIIDLSRKNAINKLNLGFDKLNELLSKYNTINKNSNPNIKLLQSDNFIELINSLSKLIKNFMTNETLLTRQLEENYPNKNLFETTINQIENNGLNFFNDAKNIFKKLKDLQSDISNNLKDDKKEFKYKPIQNKVLLKPSLSLNHYSGLMKAKKSLARNKRFLSIIGKLNNSCSNIKTNNDFSNTSLEKEYLNTNASITNNSTLINHDKKINCILHDVNSNEGIEGNKKNYSFLMKNLGRNSKSLEKEIVNLKNSFNSQVSVSKNSEEYESINNSNFVLAQKISEFFQIMNNLQKAIIQKKSNVNELKKNFEILKKKIQNYSELILKKGNNYYNSINLTTNTNNSNNNNIIIIDNEIKNERLNTNTSIEIKYEKEMIKNKLDKSNSSQKKEKKPHSILTGFSLRKIIEYENLIKIQNEKISQLESTNEILIEDKVKLNNEITKLNEELLNINKIVNTKSKQLNIKTNGHNLIDLINILISNESNKICTEKENGVSKYYEENIKLKKIIEESIEIINENIKNTGSKYLNMKIPSLYYEMGESEQSDNATFKYNKNKIIINENNAKKAVNIFKNYNHSIFEKMNKIQSQLNELKEVNDILKEIIRNTSEKVVDEKELINFEKDFFKIK